MADGKRAFGGLNTSALMSRIRSKGNRSTEMRLVTVFRAAGITGWRRGAKLAGKPDFVFSSRRVAVFVDGCYWHGCPQHFKRPSANVAYWDAKIRRNKSRDRRISRELKRSGWTVVRVWEHDLKQGHALRLLKRLKRALNSPAKSCC